MKRILTVMTAILLMLSLALPVCAAQDKPRVVDQAGLLTDSEIRLLEESIQEFTDIYGMDVVILTVDSLRGQSAQAYADNYYDRNGYGAGSDGSGLLFLLAMEEREWYISTCGQAVTVFLDSTIDDMGDLIVPYLSDGDYYYGFSIWLDFLPDYMSADSDASVSITHTEKAPKVNILVSLAIGLVVAGIVILIMRSCMNTARRQSGAQEYLRQGSYHLTERHDMFLYSHVSKTPKPKNTGSSGGGRSHGGGGGRF